MLNGEDSKRRNQDQSLQQSTDLILKIAQDNKDDSLALLEILRALESLHRQIRESLFQDSLPSNRQSLYKLLRDIEASGGWPYIHRMKLKDLLERLGDDLNPSEPRSSSSTLDS